MSAKYEISISHTYRNINYLLKLHSLVQKITSKFFSRKDKVDI